MRKLYESVTVGALIEMRDAGEVGSEAMLLLELPETMLCPRIRDISVDRHGDLVVSCLRADGAP